ncbi:hypothetical protein ACIGFK_14085 [Streptomyces sp. NPDC085524]|uniref:hypothetical protein n=1 Tax=Streptomyces sp. NPDC085524 TaxID=3365728 RepID=UPI0037CF5CBE
MSRSPNASGTEDEEGGVPRWVKISAALAVLLVVVFVAVHVAGGGMIGHTP